MMDKQEMIEKKHNSKMEVGLTEVPVVAGFDPETDNFRIETNRTKTLVQVMHCMNDNVTGRITMHPGGMTALIQLFSSTVAIIAYLEKELFDSVTCSKNISQCINMGKLYSSMVDVQKLKPNRITMQNEDNQLVIKGYSGENADRLRISKYIKYIQDDGKVVKHVDRKNYPCDVTIIVSSKEFAVYLGMMPEKETFSLTFDARNKKLLMIGNKDLTGTTVSFDLDDETVKKMLSNEVTREYSRRFKTDILAPMKKAQDLSSTVELGLNENLLMARYIIDKTTTDSQYDSVVDMYFGANIDDDEDY